MRIILIYLTVAGLMAQTKFSNVQIIPTPADVTGSQSWLERRANGVHMFTWKAPDSLAATVTLKWPTDGAAGFLYSDGAGNTSWTGAGTCGVDCMTLTTNQTAAGIKTFQNGLILQGTSTAQNLNVLPTYTLDVGTPGSMNIQLGGGSANWTNGAGVQRVLISQAGGASTVSGIVRTANATDTINSMDSSGIFSAVGFNVGTYASPIPIVDAAGLVTPVSFKLATGATNGFCLVSDAAGVGTWQTCGAGGSYVTTNTNQTSLTGTKSWDSAHTHNASILTGTANLNNIGDTAAPFGNIYSQRMQPEFIELYHSARVAYWRQYVPTVNSFALQSGSGAQQELQIDAVGPTDTRWLFRGTLYPLVSPSGANGDIGKSSNKWRDGYFSGSVNGNSLLLTGLTPFVRVGTRAELFATTFSGYDSSGAVPKIQMSWSSAGSGGLIRTYSNAGAYENGFDSTNGVLTNVGYSVGEPFGSPVQIIDNAGNATFPTLTLPVGAVNGYVWTSDAAGVGSWQVNAATGSFVTTNTNQTLIAGTKEWSDLQTYNGGVAVKLSSTARDWLPESDSAYDLGSFSAKWDRAVLVNGWATQTFSIGNGVTATSEIGPGYIQLLNSASVQGVDLGGFDGVGPVVSYSGRIRSYRMDGTTVKAGIGHSDTDKWDALNGYSVGGIGIIDEFRNVTANTIFAGFGTITGNLTVLGTCTGCSSGWTTNTTQTGLSGDKTTSGSLTVQTSAFSNAQIVMRHNSVTRWTLDSNTGNINAYSSGGALRAALYGSAGSLILATGPAGSETNTIALSGSSGVSLNNGAQTGLTTTVTIGACTMNFTYGWLTSKSGC